MTRPRPGRDTEPAIAHGDTDDAEDRLQADRDQTSHLLPRRWRPRKVGPPTVSLTDVFADRADPVITRRARI